jgi:hypothetical protein
VTDEAYRKAKKMDKDSFAPLLVPDNTDLVEIVHNCLLEGINSDRKINFKLHKLNVYSMRLNDTHTWQRVKH